MIEQHEPASPADDTGREQIWPALPLEEWRDTCATLHMWTQVVGKVRLACSPPVNHWWHVPLYVTARGLSTAAMPHGDRLFQVEFDLVAHKLRILVSDGESRVFALESFPVREFHERILAALDSLDLPVRIWTVPVEVEDPIRFELDDLHRTYQPDHANRFWRVLFRADRVMQEFRGTFLGKASPAHFFWGSFDHALTLFSGRRAPLHPGGVQHLADRVVREAYSHECSSSGFWPGGGPIPEPVFYAYAYPEPDGYRDYPVMPEQAFYSTELREYVLRYDDVRRAADPDAMLMAFLRSTYAAAADCGRWDRASLER